MFNIRYIRMKLKKTYFKMRKNVHRFYKKAVLKSKLKNKHMFIFKIKKKDYNIRLKKEINKTSYVSKRKRKYYYSRDFFLIKKKRRWNFPEKHFIKNGKRIYYVDKRKVKAKKKIMLSFKKKIKKIKVKKQFKPQFLGQKSHLIHRIKKMYWRTKG